MLATILSAALQGIEAEPVHVEVNSGERGDPKLIMLSTVLRQSPSRYGLQIRSAKRRAEMRIPSGPDGDATSYFQSLDAVLFWAEETPEFWLHCRESSRVQRLNARDQVISMLGEMTKRGIVASGISYEIGSGWLGSERVALRNAAKQANEPGWVLVAESVCRYIRSIKFHTKSAPHAKPSKPELDWFRSFTGNCLAAVVVPPRTCPRRVRGYQVQRGLRAKRLRKQELRINLTPHVRNLVQRGWKLRQIGRMIGISESTLRAWL